jgi:hypothetical protein
VPVEEVTALLRRWRDAGGVWNRGRVLAEAAQLVARLTPDERREVAAVLADTGAPELARQLEARTGQPVDRGQVQAFADSLVELDRGRLEALLVRLEDPDQRRHLTGAVFEGGVPSGWDPTPPPSPAVGSHAAAARPSDASNDAFPPPEAPSPPQPQPDGDEVTSQPPGDPPDAGDDAATSTPAPAHSRPATLPPPGADDEEFTDNLRDFLVIEQLAAERLEGQELGDIQLGDVELGDVELGGVELGEAGLGSDADLRAVTLGTAGILAADGTAEADPGAGAGPPAAHAATGAVGNHEPTTDAEPTTDQEPTTDHEPTTDAEPATDPQPASLRPQAGAHPPPPLPVPAGDGPSDLVRPEASRTANELVANLRSARSAPQRQAALRSQPLDQLDAASALVVLDAVPPGWQRRRACHRLLAAGVLADVDPAALLARFPAPRDLAFVAGDLLEATPVTVADLAPLLPAAVARRLATREQR